MCGRPGWSGVARTPAHCGEVGCVGGRRDVAERGMRSALIVVSDPVGNRLARVIETDEQALVRLDRSDGRTRHRTVRRLTTLRSPGQEAATSTTVAFEVLAVVCSGPWRRGLDGFAARMTMRRQRVCVARQGGSRRRARRVRISGADGVKSCMASPGGSACEFAHKVLLALRRKHSDVRSGRAHVNRIHQSQQGLMRTIRLRNLDKCVRCHMSPT